MAAVGAGLGGRGGGGGGGGGAQTNLATWGGDGSTVTTDDGSTFVYKNSFGGIWVSDPKNPFNNSAKPNSWTPALSEQWDWANNRINGYVPYVFASVFMLLTYAIRASA